MKTSTLKNAVLAVIASSLVLSPLCGLAQAGADKEKKEAPAGEKRQGPIPFNGKVTAVDQNAKTVTVGERVFHVGADTKMMKAGKPATLADAVVGEPIGGSYTKDDDGKLHARSLRFGPKPEEAGKKADKEE